MDTHSTHPTAPVRSRSSQSPSHSASASASASATSSIHKRKLTSDDHAPPFSADITSNDDLDSISARAGGPGSDSDDDSEDDAVVDDEEEDFDNESMRTFTAARLDNSATAAAAVRNTKIKPENSTVKVESSEMGKDGTSSAATPVGTSSVPVIVVKEDATKIFTENMQTSGTYCAREESLRREKGEVRKSLCCYETVRVATANASQIFFLWFGRFVEIARPSFADFIGLWDHACGMEEAGRLKFVCLGNDGVDQHMIWLIGLKNVFARQLPNMPKEYIVRLVMDRSHKSVMVIRRNQVVGGITYRPYVSQKFGEIAFCAITADEQVKGYGTRLMNHLKQYARDSDGLTHFLTYADNNAVGYFIKQGFTKEITLEKDRWQGYIKDYDGGILMECKIDPKLPYTDLSTMIRRQRQAIDEKIRQLSNCHIVYTGIDFQKNEVGVPRRIIKVEDIPGLKEAGWTPDQYGHSRFRTTSASADRASNRKSLTAFMRSLLKDKLLLNMSPVASTVRFSLKYISVLPLENGKLVTRDSQAMHEHPDAWPFKEPVDGRDVPDYYDIIKDPMDLKTMSKRVESEQYYITLEMFLTDVRRMFANARTYNSPDTIYFKCATRLESFFSGKVQAGLQSSSKIQQ